LAFFSLLDLAITLNDLSREHLERTMIAASILAIAAFIIVFMIRSGLDRRTSIFIQAVWRAKYFDYVFYPAMAFCSSLVALYVIVALVFTLLFAPTFGYFQGRKAARQEIASSELCVDLSPSGGGRDCMVVKDAGREVLKGRFIARSGTHIALYDGQKTTVLPLRDYTVEVPPAIDVRKTGS
jgi:hypothetical protein